MARSVVDHLQRARHHRSDGRDEFYALAELTGSQASGPAENQCKVPADAGAPLTLFHVEQTSSVSG